MTKITDIAAKHLGNKGEYYHYEGIDKGLLVAIPRAISRAESNVTVLMDGYDVWNCYEFSCLRSDGVPVSGRLKISYDSNSEFLVESKSLKLYLNSWNFHKCSGYTRDIQREIESQIKDDLEAALKTSIQVTFFCQMFDDILDLEPVAHTGFMNVDTQGLLTPFDHSSPGESIGYLRIKQNHIEGNAQRLYSNNLRSNCRVTHQPDWGDLFVHVEGPTAVDEEAFLKYILSLRKQDHFHEECCEMILNDLYQFLKPNLISVVCLYTRRGGIDINPVRFKGGSPIAHPEFRNSQITFKKTFRQ